MRYSIEPKNRIYVKGYEFLSFAKNMVKSQKLLQKLLHSAKNSTTDAINTGSKRVNQKTAEAIGDIIGNNIADKITSVSTELYSKTSNKCLPNFETKVDAEISTLKKDTYNKMKDNELLIN